MKIVGRIPALLGTASVVLALSAAPAFAHVTANPGEATAGGYSSTRSGSAMAATAPPPPRWPSTSPRGSSR